MRLLLLLILASLSLTACERIGIPDPVAKAAKDATMRDEEGKAIGGACRQSGRALEDCYTLNQNAIKASVFNGWKDMNDYMVANKIDTVKPELPPPGLASLKAEVKEEAAAEATEAKAEVVDDTGDTRTKRLAQAKADRLLKEARRKGLPAPVGARVAQGASEPKDDSKEAPKPAEPKH